jgi:uncharacterized protein (DUF1697 family)
MNMFVILLRGINVGGKNKLPMAELRTCLEELGFSNVSTYIASGNVLLESDKPAEKIQDLIEKTLIKSFKFDSELIKVLVLSHAQLKAVVESKPKGFGDELDKYHSDAVFLMGISPKVALEVFDPREGVDKIWPGEGVIYSQRLSAERTRSRLSKIVGTPAYKLMTIRSWNTVVKLLELLKNREANRVA